ncbi:MAG TPA: reverse transcriptase domain-containing protein, partial [Xanthobacteraceae bacterium]|nr:reverse transcriptase domain-containing protein [Xanthobacteraceae bacterium]
PDYFYHYKPGGHVAALHEHLKNEFFFKIDIQNFFYSIARNRVGRALRSWHVQGAQTYAKWSCIANPYSHGPRYVLPIGFRQSPILASLVLIQSPVLNAIERAQDKGVTISVYLDDFVGSYSDEQVLKNAYEDMCKACLEANLVPNEKKLVPPSKAIVAFNCTLSKGSAQVTEARIAKFLAISHTSIAKQSFDHYVARVESANTKQSPS